MFFFLFVCLLVSFLCFCLLVCCFRFKQHASVSQGQSCSGSYTCCYETEVAESKLCISPSHSTLTPEQPVLALTQFWICFSEGESSSHGVHESTNPGMIQPEIKGPGDDWLPLQAYRSEIKGPGDDWLPLQAYRSEIKGPGDDWLPLQAYRSEIKGPVDDWLPLQAYRSEIKGPGGRLASIAGLPI